MNVIDKKLKHLKYLQNKRKNYIKALEERIKAPNETIAELENQLIQLDDEVRIEPCMLFITIALAVPYALIALLSSSPIIVLGKTAVIEMIAMLIIHIPNIITYPKRKRLKLELENAKKECAPYIQKLERHLEYSKADLENRRELIQVLEAQRAKLQEQAWNNYNLSDEERNAFQDIQEEYRGKQKTIGSMLHNPDRQH